MKAVIARSMLTCPFSNLAVEDKMLQLYEAKKKKPPVLNDDTVQLFTYYNEPSVILGRYQNQFLECNPEKVKKMATLVRRNSGGGTVYHDSGCLCFSVITPRAMYSPKRSIEMVSKSLEKAGVPGTTPGPRHDLWISENKICGSAFRILSKGAYHHGTLLISTDLSSLKGSLRPNPFDSTHIQCKSVGSVRSPVVNTGGDPVRIREAIENQLLEEYGVVDVTRRTVTSLDSDEREERDRLTSLVVAGTPTFTHRCHTRSLTLDFKVAKGRVASVTTCHFNHNQIAMPVLADCFSRLLVGECYSRGEVLNCLALAEGVVERADASPYEEENCAACIEAVVRELEQEGF
eukprot:TRINITY_DN7065_c0_g1_i1.p1 TRINITY_DN7065_c0_g1~~TRINITY_DN7065_c0_g1_i1.p1  ORF type:complete len:366 (+),score=64.33 TRINITY_DN7065_c0_g1_i1:59-1099(+)